MDEENKKTKEVPEEEVVEKIEKEEEVVAERNEQDERIAQLEKELEEATNARLRALADYQNLKSRVAKEKEELLKFSQTNLILKVLDIADDFKHIIDTVPEEMKENPWFRGVNMVYEKIQQVIDTEGVAVISAASGEIFDPMLHEAIGFTTITDVALDQTIANVVNQGYKVKDGDKVIRPVRVIVNKKQ